MSMEDILWFYIDYEHCVTFVPPTTSTFAVVALRHVKNSFDLEDVFTSVNMEADHLFDEFSKKYTNVHSLTMLTKK